MGQVVSLKNVVERLSEFEVDDTIYAAKPWSEESLALVASEPAEGGLPLDAKLANMDYFIEISIAKDFCEDWSATLNWSPSSSELCRRLIQYAIHDA